MGLVLLLVFYGSATIYDARTAAGGVLELDDLSAHPARLQGEWEFYWRQLLTPEDFQRPDAPQAEYYISLPRSWKGYVWEGEALPSEGYATFRLRLQISERDVGKTLALRIPSIFHAYKLWIDGKLSAEVGQVGPDKNSTVPRLATRFVAFQPQTEQVELVMQVANFHHVRGGVTKHIEIGDRETLWRKTVFKYAAELFMTASLLIIGIYHLLLYILRRKDKAFLYFGLVTTGWSLRSLVVGELLLTQMFPDFPWELQLKLEYLALYIGIFLFTMYFYHLFKEETPRWFRVTSGVLALAFSFLVVVAPAKIFSQTLALYELGIAGQLLFYVYALLLARKRRKEGAVVFLIVVAILGLTAVNDFLYFSEKVLFGTFSVLGMFVFTFAQMYMLSSRFVKAESELEQTARQLAATNERLVELNKNLEHIVQERTRELQDANEQLRQAYDRLLQAEEGRRKLLSYISHDLKAPLSTMLGYVEVVQDNIRPEKNPIYLKYVHERILWLHRMIDDLSFLSHLEIQQVPFTMYQLSLETYLHDFWQKFEPVIRESGLRSDLKMPVPDVAQPAPQVWADPVRLEQALSNLLSNALKFTPRGGTISLSLTYRELNDGPHAVIGLADPGIGIQPDRLEKIFERNYKRYPSGYEAKSAGSGLGLAITREIVETHKGKVWAESNGVDGSTFFIALPLISQGALPEKTEQ